MTAQELRNRYPFCLLDEGDFHAFKLKHKDFDLEVIAAQLTLAQQESKKEQP